MLDNHTRLEDGSYFADVLQTTSGAESFWYYVIQCQGSTGIIEFVKFDTAEEALQAARQALVSFSKGASSASAQ